MSKLQSIYDDIGHGMAVAASSTLLHQPERQDKGSPSFLSAWQIAAGPVLDSGEFLQTCRDLRFLHWIYACQFPILQVGHR